MGRRLVTRTCAARAECLHKGHQRLMPCQGRWPWPSSSKGLFEQQNEIRIDEVDRRRGWRRPEQRACGGVSVGPGGNGGGDVGWGAGHTRRAGKRVTSHEQELEDQDCKSERIMVEGAVNIGE